MTDREKAIVEAYTGFVMLTDDKCPMRALDPWYSQMPDDDWFCANGEKEDKS